MSDRNRGIEVRHIDRIVGVFIIGAIFIALGSWFLRLQGLGELEEKYPFHTIISESFGLASGGEIDLAGITIGTIENVTLQDDGQVRVDMEFFSKYIKFLTVGSQLEVEPTIGVQSILGGGGLIYNYNHKETKLLEPGTLLTVVEPVDFAAQIEAFDLPGLADQVKSIVNNVEEITSHLKEDQGALFATLDNINDMTADLAKSADDIPILMNDFKQQIPKILGSVEENLGGLQEAMGSVTGILTNSEGDIKSMIGNASGATDQLNKAAADLNKLLVELDKILKDVGASSEKLPGVLSRSEDLLDNSVELTDKLNNHWLLGGEGEDGAPKQWPSIHSIGESPYDEVVE